ncbi:hypothetical protein EG68_12559 [Paragonimus skrjabini miyazakii]|uniref:Uncharacterized protein n=1 Tax=Paragonimus skrjabini miyazakii TaxID=59628 RepID=A0A8S9YJM8_9TREM|nr:hypothetical protein EG68_12559 [Paragonimus skrjabini miyazakii]
MMHELVMDFCMSLERLHDFRCGMLVGNDGKIKVEISQWDLLPLLDPSHTCASYRQIMWFLSPFQPVVLLEGTMQTQIVRASETHEVEIETQHSKTGVITFSQIEVTINVEDILADSTGNLQNVLRSP